MNGTTNKRRYGEITAARQKNSFEDVCSVPGADEQTISVPSGSC